MKILEISMILALIVGITSGAGAQDHEPPTPNDSANDVAFLKTTYLGSPDLPDGAAFAFTMRVFGSPDPENRRFSVSMVKKALSLDSKAEAEVMVDKFIDVNKRMLLATEEALAANSCVDGVPKVYGNSAYQALDAMDDTEVIVADEFYVELQKELGPDMGQRLRDWIDREKLSINAERSDSKKMHARAGRIGDETLAQICIKLEHNERVRRTQTGET